MNPLIYLKNARCLQRCRTAGRTPAVLTAVVVACFALSPPARAVVPAPDGGYPGQNTAEGEDALFSLDTQSGLYNTGLGWRALYLTGRG
jgi:hypothetical protein